MKAPNNSPYGGYSFLFDIDFPTNYPNSPPQVKCTTNVYHMNISTSGSVCVSSVKNEWNKANNINTVLKSIFVIFKVPNPESPHRSDIAQLYKNDRAQYEKNVKEHCEKYAIKIKS
jgi:ubiquitin-conjugating enzyme E2 D/E